MRDRTTGALANRLAGVWCPRERKTVMRDRWGFQLVVWRVDGVQAAVQLGGPKENVRLAELRRWRLKFKEAEVAGIHGKGHWRKSLTERSMDCRRWVSDWVLLWGFWGELRRWGGQQSWEPMQTARSSPSHQPEGKDFIIYGALDRGLRSFSPYCVCECVRVCTLSH